MSGLHNHSALDTLETHPSICAYLQKRIDEEEKIIEQAKRLEEAKKYRESHEREVLVAAKAFDESVVAARNAALNRLHGVFVHSSLR